VASCTLWICAGDAGPVDAGPPVYDAAGGPPDATPVDAALE
jgi:hypothetical protein